ncbi:MULTISPECIES: H-NS family nucleoid-associated regulatory protein [Stenotrophomonas]|jgi:DNA-binding protein H-NS|uniref:H-NS family nucleoid-associated regulatory protein n=1 Tax=Stenotrophomonas TaxID=40323 RepID=UPI001311AF7C|nr:MULTISPECIES: H-NS family nucleoid-associated regulatory protein [Stenotrophomonas]MBA0350872.1 histone-like nucleoid-structuring protein [Stenotrophomonas maltophilia]MBW8374968.1 H-NS histone family protein [Stenotrophomonas sp.]WIA63260.1 H-NS family nucleoid-associated regulatory protein [Stenotrophomonas sp. BIO128-Bstrain]
MSKAPGTTLEAIASAKAKLAEELKKLEEQEVKLMEEEASSAFANVSELLNRFGHFFSAKQKSEIANHFNATSSTGKKSSGSRKEVAQKYWLPHTQETWSGRGRTPRAFAAWEGSAAYKEWKAAHPDEKFPKFPG